MYFAANGVLIGADYSQVATFPAGGGWFPYPMNKLDAFVNGTDAVVQLLTERSGWQNEVSEEMLFRIGFNARDPLPPFYAVRFRIYPGTKFNPTSGTIDITVFNV